MSAVPERSQRAPVLPRAVPTRPRRPQRGSSSVFVIGFAVVLLGFAGLVIDGGKALNARMRLADATEQAARAGANAIDLEALRSGGRLRVDPVEARSAVHSYFAHVDHTSVSVTVSGNQVTVQATDRVPTALLGLVGIGSYTVEAQASSDACTHRRAAAGGTCA